MPEILISGPEGRIEARYHAAEDPSAPVALVLHPHPLHGGTMNNKVAYLTYKMFSDKGFNVMRFNFRGVGQSEGTYGDGEGELTDAAAMIDWLQSTFPNARSYFVAGFSFGAWIAMQLLMRRPEIQGFIAIAPPANKYDFSFLAPCPVSGMIIHGDKDEIVPYAHVEQLADRLSKQRGLYIDFRTINGADHFFRDKMEDLSSHLSDHMESLISPEYQPIKMVANM